MNKTLLIIEDNEADAVHYQRMLERQPKLFNKIEVCRTIEAARHEIDRELPACCILDYSLPDGHADEFINYFVQDNGLLGCPVIVVTGQGSQEIAVKLMKFGVQNYLVKENFDAQALFRALEAAMRSYKTQREVYYLAHHDPLTGVFNRAFFMSRLKHEISCIDRYHSRKIFVAVIDLDKFKAINDTLGHDIGDVVLQTLADRVTGCIRESDSFARLGGDEFALILTINNNAEGHLVIQKILDSVVEPIQLDLNTLHMTISIGVTSYPSECGSQEREKLSMKALLKQADLALYQAKLRGRNCYTKYSYLMKEADYNGLSLYQFIPQALNDGLFKVAYQPIFKPNSVECESVQAQLTLVNNDQLVPPNEVLEVIQNLGLDEVYYTWLFKTSLLQLKDWLVEKSDLTMYIALNESTLHKKPILEDLVKWVEHYQVNPRHVIIEVSESYFAKNLLQALENLRYLHVHQIQVSLDNYGTGQCSFETLSRIPCKRIKLTRKLLELNQDNSAMTKSLVDFLHAIGKEVMLEGVDDSNCKAFANSLGAESVQGSAFAKPMTSERYAWHHFISKSIA